MFVDRAKIEVKAGRGGDGVIKSTRFRKRATGGNGGRGGHVYLEGTINRYDLKFTKGKSKYSAEDGYRGEDNRKKGKDGEDLIIKVPLITEVYDTEGNRICSIESNGERVIIARGGDGGIGNYEHRVEPEGWSIATPGSEGEERTLILKLVLAADVIFIGFPNSGKSSMLNELTNAKAKVAPYPFTTIEPNLGLAGDLKLMDLPGLIEGTYKGKGLGTGFLKHTDRAKLVAHFISLEGNDPLDAYKIMRKELKNISEELYQKEEVIVLTKHDVLDPETVKSVEKMFHSEYPEKDLVSTSIHDLDSINTLYELFKKKIM
ncbi:MAG TPA: Obg family GTPase CgtA [bacterium]|nr:Obg family GTPase CgtA [bacterium]